MSEKGDPYAAVRRDELYTLIQVREIMGVRKELITEMCALGLPYIGSTDGPKGKRFIVGGDLIDFLKVYSMARRMAKIIVQKKSENDKEGESTNDES